MKNSFASRLEELRGARTQKEFAKFLGVPLTSYTNWALRMRTPNIDILESICTQLRVSADYLLGLSDEPHASKSAGNVSINGHSNAIVNGSAHNSPVTLGGHCEGCDGLIKLKTRVDGLERRLNLETPLYVTER